MSRCGLHQAGGRRPPLLALLSVFECPEKRMTSGASILTLWPTVLALVAALDVPAVLQTCISDEVQAGTRTVQAEDWGQTSTAGWEESPPHHLSGLLMEKRRRTMVPQPIRIHSWISWESSSLSEAERRTVEMAVHEAVGKVSELLSGGVYRHTHPHTHSLSLSHIKSFSQQLTDFRVRCCSAETFTNTASSSGGIQALPITTGDCARAHVHGPDPV